MSLLRALVDGRILHGVGVGHGPVGQNVGCHRGVHRGVGGIFFDHMENGFDADFALVRDVGEAFLDVYPRIVRRRMDTPFTQADLVQMRAWRGRYVEFNLVHDRGTLFGLKTGGNIDAILMSLPPVATWD